jgi:hypothetical protein
MNFSLLVSPPPNDVSLFMRVAVSLALLGSSLFVILSKRYTPQDKHWAYTTIGAIMGFWINSK